MTLESKKNLIPVPNVPAMPEEVKKLKAAVSGNPPDALTAGREKTKAKASKKLAENKLAVEAEQALPEARKRLGEPDFTFESAKSGPDRLVAVIEKLAASFAAIGKSWDAFCAILAPLKLNSEEIEATLNKPGAFDEKVPAQPKNWKARKFAKDNTEIGWNEWHRGESALRTIEKRNYNECANNTARKYGLPFAYVCAVAQAESGCNPEALNKKSGAFGIGQGMPSTIRSYLADRNSKEGTHLTREDYARDPAVQFDLIGWHARGAIDSVERMISQGKLAAKHTIDPNKVEGGLVECTTRLYATHNMGAGGYASLCRYLDNPTDENFKRMPAFMQARNGDGYQERWKYAQKVGRIAAAIQQQKEGDTTPEKLYSDAEKKKQLLDKIVDPYTDAPGSVVAENTNLKETSHKKTWEIGDSLFVGMTNLFPKGHISPNEIVRASAGWLKQIGSAVGGSLTKPMADRMERDIAEKKMQGVEKVVIEGGVNDAFSGRPVEHIKKQFERMISLARENGMQVVICTIPSCDTEDWARKHADFCNKHGLTGELIKERILAVNDWMRAQHAAGKVDGLVDLYTTLGSYDTKENGLKRSDQIHFKDYRVMARAVIQGARIGDSGAVS